MKILGKVLINKSNKSYTGLLIDCSEEEVNENGICNIQHNINLYNKRFCIVVHNESTEHLYAPAYAKKIAKDLGYRYSRHVFDTSSIIMKILQTEFKRIKIM